MRYATILIVLVTSSLASNDSASNNSAMGADWLTARSFYTHDPATGQRTHQFSEPPPAIVKQAASFQTSGFSHYRSTLQYGQSADNYHRVEQWGPPVRPYGEWRFPYRPYSAPYDQWGAPFAGLNLGFGGGFVGPRGGLGGGLGGGYPDPRYGNPGNGVAGDWQNNGPNSQPGGRFGNDRDGRFPQFPVYPPYPSEPYPSGPGFQYPVPPYADGYYPDYSARPRLDDRDFYRKPTQGRFDRENR